MTDLHIVGIDAGGTGSRIVARSADASGPARSSDGPGANLQVLGVNGTAKVLYELIRDVYRGPLSHLVVVAGVAGAGRPVDRTTLAAALSSRLRVDAARVRVLSDAELTLDAAFGPDEPGMIVIVGTGSIACARGDDGALVRAGGWGYLLGDEGGGRVIGMQGLAAVADALDGGPDTALVRAARSAWGIQGPEELVAAVYREKRSAASFAPHVIAAAESGDAIAETVVATQTAAIAERAAWAAARTGTDFRRLALWGGLARNPYYRRRLVGALARSVPGWTIEAMRDTPIDAALERARAMARTAAGG